MSKATSTPNAANSNGPSPQAGTASLRKFLVVVDETPECRLAVRFAARRAEHTGGVIELLCVVEPVEFQHWLGVETLMQEGEAETALTNLVAEVRTTMGIEPETVIREGKAHEQIIALIEEDPGIRVLVLGASSAKEGPGPLVSAIAGQGAGAFNIPITIVPGDLTEEQIDELT